MTSRVAATSNAPIQYQPKGPENQPRDSRCVKDPIHPKNKGRTADSRAIWKGRQRVTRSRIAKSEPSRSPPAIVPGATCQVCAIRQLPIVPRRPRTTALCDDKNPEERASRGVRSAELAACPAPGAPPKRPPKKNGMRPRGGRWRVESQRRRVAFARPHSLGNSLPRKYGLPDDAGCGILRDIRSGGRAKLLLSRRRLLARRETSPSRRLYLSAAGTAASNGTPNWSKRNA